MNQLKRLEPILAAKEMLNERFPTCEGAILAGSVIRGEATHTSDLDIVIFDHNMEKSYRESFFAKGWPVELFVHNASSYKQFFQNDCLRGRPTLPNMIAEGIVLKGEESINRIKMEAQQLLDAGPENWTEETIEIKRYFITDTLEDLEGTNRRDEALFIANNLAVHVSEFYLRTNNQWVGNSKWVVRALKKYDTYFAEMFIDAFDSFYRDGEKNKVITLVDNVLKPHGGRLFEGFSIGKKERMGEQNAR